MLAESSGAAIDLRYMMPSCVPATPIDISGATLDAGGMISQNLPGAKG
ncbi:MAG: hypothetical protein METHP_00053 [Methanoregula sp. SKADARSKE-2]|nr:MAG: hypothetical protein METHP_00053 [Methanoregula sp. SKADARSKE-2]